MLRHLGLASFILLVPSLASAQTAKFHIEEATIEDIQMAILRGQLTSTRLVQLYLTSNNGTGKLVGEDVAEIEYQPGQCGYPYRVVIVRKNISVQRGEKVLLEEVRYFFYITNRTDKAAKIVGLANGRCDQENVIEQMKNGVKAKDSDKLVRELAGAFAQQATLAIENARLHQEAEQRMRILVKSHAARQPGNHRYHLSEFGFSEEEVLSAFASYCQQFGLCPSDREKLWASRREALFAEAQRRSGFVSITGKNNLMDERKFRE